MKDQQNKQDSDPVLRTETGEAYDIPVGGSLGLLALGYSGLMLWRQKRAEVNQKKANQNPQSNMSPSQD